LSLDFKKAQVECPQTVKPVIRTFAVNKGSFRENEKRIKKRYVNKPRTATHTARLLRETAANL
jgi:hypothetical protein